LANESVVERLEKMKTVSATEAKNRLGALLSELANGTEAIVIEHYGRPRAVIVSAEEWAALNEARMRLRRLEAWERIRALAEKVGARNADLSQQEIDALADEIGDEAKRRVAQRLDRR
jgi:prevent-host-death family protein